ncbi:MAG TPA: M15 family metallopeptidase [Bacteroidales bacterium]|nr:M15 family metallopeptidase [Bacteroidales bacterium]
MKLFFLCFFIQFFFSSPGSITQNLRYGYAEMAEADTSLGILILVNKHHKLAEGYRPHDLVPVDDRYNRGIMNLLRSEAAAAFAQMCSTAEKDSIILWNHSAYRSDTVQRQLYENAVERRGVQRADRFSARPGHSEHQTGLTVDLNSTHTSFGKTPEAAWLRQHAHLFGFIERYPRHQEDITGYEYEPWHYRYVGIEAATYIYNNKLTLEEYHGTSQKQTRHPAR